MGIRTVSKKFKEKYGGSLKKFEKRAKQSICIATALYTIFAPTESEKPTNFYHKIMTRDIGKIYNFRQEIIDYPSKDYYSRNNNKISLIIIHTTDTDSEKDSLEWLAVRTGVSAHYVVAKDGKIYSLVPEQFAARHCGYSCNQRAIGIEMVQGVHGHFYKRKEIINSLQLDQTVSLVKILMENYNIPKKNIIGHHEFNRRKGDPGERNMGAILSRLP